MGMEFNMYTTVQCTRMCIQIYCIMPNFIKMKFGCGTAGNIVLYSYSNITGFTFQFCEYSLVLESVVVWMSNVF